ncbi:hypothetical protein BUALT_Bualt01G0112400 [Buddleja alternifolia]|uniref:AP2/ERF domain-containing protein n=1 Tax=Buddleja alternifolia TaxID=168488 RepID=A0AAV6Y6A3_9LAMI|nr:hypothetical protein BUALT_Bualt01G0112400 [Buddleja alternifolia]
MGSMNNWLGFSLSPHHHHHNQDQSQNSVSELDFNSDEISGSGTHECFDLTNSDHSNINIPSLNLNPPPFGILEAFNTSNTTTQSHQDWNMKDMSMNSYSCSNQETPKLENFLGHSFTDHNNQAHNKIQAPSNTINGGHENNNYSNIYMQEAAGEPNSHTNTNNSSAMGLSMIKNWLRNNPAPPHVAETKEAAAEALPPGPVAGSQSLSLSMSTGSQADGKLNQNNSSGVEGQSGAIESVPRKSIDTFGQRTSIYRGVTRYFNLVILCNLILFFLEIYCKRCKHRWTGRYEAHLWDNSCRREGQTRKGRQGFFIRFLYFNSCFLVSFFGMGNDSVLLQFTWISNYEKEMEDMKHMTRQEYVASLRRKSSGFSRGASIYRGVTRHHQHGRWQARIGRVAGNKDLYLGTFSTQEEAAEAYDIAAIKFRGLNAVTNFEINRYDVKSILESTTLPIGGAAKRLKDAENAEMALEMHRAEEANLNSLSHINHAGWPTIAFQQPLNMYPFAHQRLWCKQEQDQGINDIHHQQQQIQLGNNTQNFMQTSVLHNLMSLDHSSSMQNGPGSNAVVYNANEANGNGFVMSMMGNGISFDQENKGVGYEGMFGSSENNGYNQQARNLYYQQSSSSSSSSSGVAKVANIYDPGSTCNDNWIPTAVPTLAAARANHMAVCHGASTFTVWNDT